MKSAAFSLALMNAAAEYLNFLCANGMKSGDKRTKLEEEKGIVIRFVIGHRYVMPWRKLNCAASFTHTALFPTKELLQFVHLC